MGEGRLLIIYLRRFPAEAESGEAAHKFNWVLEIKHLISFCGAKDLWSRLDLVSLKSNKEIILSKFEAHRRVLDLNRLAQTSLLKVLP